MASSLLAAVAGPELNQAIAAEHTARAWQAATLGQRGLARELDGEPSGDDCRQLAEQAAETLAEIAGLLAVARDCQSRLA